MHRLFQCARHLAIEERHQLVAAVDDPDLGAQRGERAGVLAADDPRTDDGQRPGQPIELEDRVGVEDPGVVEGKTWGPNGRGAGGDQDRLGAQLDLVVAPVSCRSSRIAGYCPAVSTASPVIGHDADRVGIDERGHAAVQDHAIPGKVPLDPLALVGRDPPLVEHEIGHGRLAAKREVHAVEVAGP